MSIPDGWPEFPKILAPLEENQPPSTATWPLYFFLLPTEHALVGSGGFLKPPTAAGEVEIGYEVAPRFRNRGLATAALKMILQRAFSHDAVRMALAYTMAGENASSTVLKKVGMSFAGEHSVPSIGQVWRWQLLRESFAGLEGASSG